MDYFKKRAKEILLSEKDIDNDGAMLSLGNAYKNLKNSLRKPTVVHAGSENKPHYMKMTFAMCRNAVNGERFLELSKL